MVYHDKAHTMSGYVVKVGKGAHAGAQFRIIDWIDHGILIPTEQMLADYEQDRIVQGHPIDNDVLIGWISQSEAVLKHVRDLDLEHSRSMPPNSTGAG